MDKKQFIARVEDTVRQFHMLKPGDRVILGVSGGADSVALLRVLMELKHVLNLEIRVVHIEHGIRGKASEEDALWVEKMCRQWRLDFIREDVDAPGYGKEKGLTEEEAGRVLRYETFEREAVRWEARGGGQVKIAVAHHANDNAETMLFALARGTGLDGLCGIPPVRGRVIRPLLNVSRGQIEEYLKEIGQDYRTDATNEEVDYSRNRIRHRIIPEMEVLNAKAVSHMSRTGEILREANALIERQAYVLWKKYVLILEDERVTLEEGDSDGPYGYREETLIPGQIPLAVTAADLGREESSLIRREVLHRVISQITPHGKDITADHIYALEDLLLGGVGRKVTLPYDLMAIRGYESLQFFRVEEHLPDAGQEGSGASEEVLPGDLEVGDYGKLTWNDQNFEYRLKSAAECPVYSQKTYTKSVDYDKIKFILRLRSRLPKDEIVVNEKGQHQSLKKYFINEKVPSAQRGQIPLFCDGNQVVWIVGYRMSQAYQVDETTSRVLEIRRID